MAPDTIVAQVAANVHCNMEEFSRKKLELEINKPGRRKMHTPQQEGQ